MAPPTRRLPLDEQAVARLAADSKGYVMIADERVVRRNREGAVLWRSAKGDFVDAAPASDGSVWALLRTDDNKVALRHFADP